jgi:flagellar assembly protein FliH
MILLSKIIKSSNAVSSQSKSKIISVKTIRTEKVNSVVEEEISLEEMYLKQEKMIEEATEKANSIIDNAQAELQQIQERIQQEKERWQSEKEVLIKEAYDEGVRLGEADGKEKAYAEYSGKLEEANTITEVAKKEYYDLLEKAEGVILDIAITTAERILGSKLEDSPELFLPLVRRGLKEVRDLTEVQLHIHPSKYTLLESNKDELEAVFPANIQCYLYANDELSENDCFIETNQGRVVVSVDSQLNELKEKLFTILEGEKE